MPEPSVSSIAIYQLRVVLCGVSPLVWRRLLVVSTTSIAELHEVLQNAFGWSGEHLHRFLIHGAAYGIPCLGGIVFPEDARRVPLSRFRLHCGERFRYEYDFMADWKLDIRLERALPFDPNRALPSCIGGSRAAPPEDCAGALDYLKRLDWHRSHLPIDELNIMAEAMRRFLDSDGNRQSHVAQRSLYRLHLYTYNAFSYYWITLFSTTAFGILASQRFFNYSSLVL